jgi:hypothetical protein
VTTGLTTVLRRLRWSRWRGHGAGWWLGVTVAGLLAAAVVWLLVTGYLAYRAARTVDDGLAEVNRLIAAGDVAGASAQAAKLADSAHTAHQLTSGPAWWAAAHVPYAGEPARVVRELSASADRLGSSTFPLLVRLGTELRPEKLRVSSDTINLEPLVRNRAALARAAADAVGARQQLDALPSDTYLGIVDQAHAKLRDRLDTVIDIVRNVDRAAKIVPAMAGHDGPRRFVVGLQNEAELRGTGGLPGNFVIVVLDHGRIRFTHFLSDTAFLPAGTGQLVKTGLDLGAEYRRLYGRAKPTELILNSNMHPDFRFAGRIWAEMWQRVSGERVHGAIATDPTALSYLLEVIGPVTVPGGVRLTAQNVVAETQSVAYARFADDNVRRKQYLVDILRAVQTTMLRSPETVDLLNAFGRAAGEGRLLVWSRDAAVQAVLEQTALAGDLPRAGVPLAGLVLNNIAGNKLDYYLHRSFSYQRSGCASSRDVIVAITLLNQAPPNLPPIVMGRLDKPRYPTGPGDNRIQLDYYATTGAVLQSATLNGKPRSVAVLSDGSHPVIRLDLELPRGAAQQLVLHLTEPAGTGPPVILRQPGVTPLAVTLDNQSC